MKIISIQPLALPQILVIQYKRFSDERGYFTETFNKKDICSLNNISSLTKFSIKQSNESFSHKNTIRGLHFQWNPFMGKLVRTVYGHMVDVVLDIRPNSETFGKAILYDMPANQSDSFSELIWVPPGFAHGNFFLEETLIEYYCDGTYNPGGEMGIFPFSSEIDWSLVDSQLYAQFAALKTKCLMSPKDKKGLDLTEWKKNANSNLFSKL